MARNRSDRVKSHDMLLCAGKAAKTRRAVETYRIKHEEIIDAWEALQLNQVEAEKLLREQAIELGRSGDYPKLGLSVTVTHPTNRIVDAAQLLHAVPSILNFESTKHGKLINVMLGTYDVAVATALIPLEVDARIVTYIAGAPRVSVKWTKIG